VGVRRSVGSRLNRGDAFAAREPTMGGQANIEKTQEMIMSKFMYFVLFIIVVGTAYVVYQYYLESQESAAFENSRNGVSVEGK
jgi:hypothetical protein